MSVEMLPRTSGVGGEIAKVVTGVAAVVSCSDPHVADPVAVAVGEAEAVDGQVQGFAWPEGIEADADMEDV